MIHPKKAILLSAGLGTRMRPLTLQLPKPLVSIHGRALIDRALDALQKAGVEEVVVNVHHLAGQMEVHLKERMAPKIIISDERAELLDSAGGVVKALSHLGHEPFYILNSDTFWVDDGSPSLSRLADVFDAEKMDMLLLTVRRDQASGPEKGDFLMDDEGRLCRAPAGRTDAVIYGGALIATPKIFAGAKTEPHSLNLYFDRAIQKNRLYGLALEGAWYTVGTMEMIGIVEGLLNARGEK